MKDKKGLYQLKAAILTLMGLLLAATFVLLLPAFPANSGPVPAAAPTVNRSIPDVPATIDEPAEELSQVLSGEQSADPDWMNNNGRFTEATTRLVKWLDAGNSIAVDIDGQGPVRYGFRGIRVTSEDFRISNGIHSQMPAQYEVYSGRELLANGSSGETAALAVVNGAVAMAVTREGTNYLVETDPVSGKLYAYALESLEAPHGCSGSGCSDHHTECSLSQDGRLASITAPGVATTSEAAKLPVRMTYDSGTILNADEPEQAAASVSHPYFRHGPKYDASLKDIIVMWTSSKSQTGDSSGLSSRAASYFTVAARTADVYERQLGLRYLLQELILLPSDSSEEDPGNGLPELADWRTWLTTHRPQAEYQWGHAALWGIVDGAPGGVVGRAWVNMYGSATYGHSIQERNWGWEVHSHELGHNVGSSHSEGGVMNASLIMGNENFFTMIAGGTITAAKDIYDYMGSATRPFVFGPANLRHPEEMPFGVDDLVSTPAGSSVTFNPLANDQTSVNNGVTNSLRLIEVGQVYPRAAGSAKVIDGQIQFVPAAGFTGQAWFSYTLSGSVGNSGSGWMHDADVIVTVGGNSTAPSGNPALTVVNDYLISDFSMPVSINPLLNDEATGRLWAGDVEVVLGPNDTTAESYSDQAFHLVNAVLVSGSGSISLEKRAMSRGGSLSQQNSGWISYTPGGSESSDVTIQYTVEDAFGNTATGIISISRTTSLTVMGSTASIAEDSGEVVAFTFERTGSVDLAKPEVIHFSMTGTADPCGLRADYALAGQDVFDPISGLGSVTIPAGERQAYLYAAILDDGVDEDYEDCTLILNSSSSAMLISPVYGQATIYIRDNSVIYVEPFDSFNSDSASWSGWSNSKNMNPSGKGGEDWFDWAVLSGSTPTGNTGPASDHTTGSGNYMYAEASGNVGEFAYLQSPAINISGRQAAELAFAYHMFGNGLGALTLDLYVDGSLAAPAFWRKTGQQSTSSTDWRTAILDLSPYLPASTIQLRFRADIGTSELSDIAIDDVQVLSVTEADPLPPQVLVDPADASVEMGESVYLSVIPEGFPAPNIQWHHNGVPIPGATGASFFIAAVDTATAGDYSALVSNPMGAVSSLPATVDLPGDPPDPAGQSYMFWVAEYGLLGSPTEPNVSGLDLDPDLDGLSNLLEFAFGSSPVIPGAELPVISVQEVSGQRYLEITYRRRKNVTDPGTGTTGINYQVDDITYTVETSTTINGSWSSGVGVVAAVGSPVDNGDGTETVTVRRLTPIGSGTAFLRLSVVAGFTF